MEITPLIKAGYQVIQSYGPRGIKINGIVYGDPVIVMPEAASVWDAPHDVAGLTSDHFAPFMPLGLDVVLLGTGGNFAFLSDDIKRALKAQGINVDVMDTGAACRTYNVLMAEGRHIAAALLPVV